MSKTAAGARLVVYRSKRLLRAETWRWQLVHRNGNVLAEGGEGYANQADCLAQAEKVVTGVYAEAAVEVDDR